MKVPFAQAGSCSRYTVCSSGSLGALDLPCKLCRNVVVAVPCNPYCSCPGRQLLTRLKHSSWQKTTAPLSWRW